MYKKEKKRKNSDFSEHTHKNCVCHFCVWAEQWGFHVNEQSMFIYRKEEKDVFEIGPSWVENRFQNRSSRS